MLINITHYLYTPLHYLYERSSKKPAPTNENLMYIFTSLIHPVINYREFVRSRLLHSEYHKET